jgi:hypothetical protein
MDNQPMKYVPIIGMVTFGSLILFFIVYKISNIEPSTPNNSKGSKTYKKSISLDKLYDEAGGNDALSDGIMTSQIDLSTENNSCGFMVTYKGVKDRKVICTRGCNDDEDEDENSKFCKQFIYEPENASPLVDTFLDQTYTRRRGNRNIEEATTTPAAAAADAEVVGDEESDEGLPIWFWVTITISGAVLLFYACYKINKYMLS